MFFCGTMKKSPQDGQAKGDDFMPTMDLVPYDSGIQFGTRYLTKEAAFFKRGEIRKQAKTLISSRFKDSGQTGYK